MQRAKLVVDLMIGTIKSSVERLQHKEKEGAMAIIKTGIFLQKKNILYEIQFNAFQFI